MRIPYKPLIATIRAAALPLLLLFGHSAHCTTVDKARVDEQAKLGMAPAKPAGARGAANPATPITIEKTFALALSANSSALPEAVPMSWQPVATLEFDSLADRAVTGSATSQNSEPVRTGFLAWRVSPEGTQVKDVRTGQSASISNLTSSDVRPRSIVYDERLGTVWFYGETLYRYRMASRTLERLQLHGEAFRAIRKAVNGPSGLWLAAGNGIFVLDKNSVSLKKIRNAGADGASIINAAATGKEIWFATAGARLVRITDNAPDQPLVAISARLPGDTAEMIIASSTLWVLLSDKHGDHYKVAYVDQDRKQVSVITGKYFSLGEDNGQITASAYDTVFHIDPVARTIARLKISETGLLARAARRESVLFAGSSYGYKDNCEIVEHGQVDISKGWVNALNDPMFR